MSKVYVVMYANKSCDFDEGVDVYSSEASAYASIADVISMDIKDGRYASVHDEETGPALKAAIEAKDWPKMMQVHDDYWYEYSQPDRWAVLETEIKA